MVDKINMQKILSPIAYSAKVKEVKNQKDDTHQRRFESQLKEQQEEEKKKKRDQGLETAVIDSDKDEAERAGDTEDKEGKNKTVEKEASDGIQGRLIDILI